MAKKVTTPVSNTPESVASGGAGDPASTAAAAEPATGAASPVEATTALGAVHAASETSALTPANDAAEPSSEAGAVSPVEAAIAVGGELAALAPSVVTLPAVHYTEVLPKATELRSFAVTKPVRYQRRRYAKGEPVTVDMDAWAVLFAGGVLAEEWDAVTAGEA